MVSCVPTMLARKWTQLIRDGRQPAVCQKLVFARRNHYQSLCEKCEHSLAHAKEQIRRNANALLFESIVEEQELVLNLIALRHQWQRLSQECDRQIYHAS